MTSALVLAFALLVQVTPELRQHVEAGLKAKSAGDLETAAREFQRVVELAPTLPAAHVNLGAVYYARKDYARAIPSLRKALELNPDLPGAEAMLGGALLAQGYAAESIPHLQKGQSADLLGVALLEAGRPREAVDTLEAALAQRPADPDLLYYLAQAHDRLARTLAAQLRATGAASPRAAQLQGEEAAAAGNHEAAERHFRSALQSRPDLRGIHLALGELYLESGDFEKAGVEFQAEVALAPGSAQAAFRWGQVLLNRGSIPEAIAELQRADRLRPAMPETILELGKALAAAGDLSAAEARFQQVLTEETTSVLAQTAHFQLAQLYRRTNRPTEAARHQSAFEKLRHSRQ